MTNKRSKRDQGKLFAFRSWAPYSERLESFAATARLKPNQVARVATMFFVDSGVLGLKEKMQRIEEKIDRLADEQIRLRKTLVDLTD